MSTFVSMPQHPSECTHQLNTAPLRCFTSSRDSHPAHSLLNWRAPESRLIDRNMHTDSNGCWLVQGVLSVHGYGAQKFLFQGVHETICYGPSDKAWQDDEPRINQIVFIGRNLDRKTIVDGFRTCIWVPLPEGAGARRCEACA